jgi:hypothetical protein
MSDPLRTQVVKISDGDAIQRLLSIIGEPGGEVLNDLEISFFQGEPLHINRSEFEDHEELNALKKLEGQSLRSIYLRSSRNQSKGVKYSRQIVAVNQPDQNTLFDVLEVYPGSPSDPPLPRAQFTQLAEVAQRSFRGVSIANLGAILGPDVAKHFAAREEALSSLESLGTRLIQGTTEQRNILESEYSAKARKLEDERAKVSEEESQKFRTRMEAVAEREKQLDEKLKALDDRSSTHVRRELRQAISKALADQSRLKFSTDTGLRRWSVLAAYFAILLLTGIPAILLFIQGYGSTFDPWSFGRQVVLSISFLLTIGFLIRLLNDWAEKSAKEELKLRQMEIDIDRASWLVELLFEFKTNKGEELPKELMQQLSKNLFGVDEDLQHGTNAAQTLATALLSSASGLKFNLPGGLGELSFDGKSMKRLERTPIEDS